MLLQFPTVWLATLAVLLAFAPAPRASAAAASWPDTPLSTRAKTQDIVSTSTGRTYRIFVFVPSAPPPPAGYPVLYLLDGNSTYPLAANLLQLAEHRTNPGGLVPGIVVGIGYPGDAPLDMVARAEDYTPPAPDLSATGDMSGNRQGGADRFLDFIEKELKPRLAADFKIDPARQTLFGHSYGGLFVLHTLFTRPASFQRYVAASPSIWWNQRHILTEKDAWLKTHPASTPSPQIVITVGSLEQTPSSDPRLAHRAELVISRRQVDNAKDLAMELAANGWTTEFFLLEKNDHGTARIPALVHALRVAFE